MKGQAACESQTGKRGGVGTEKKTIPKGSCGKGGRSFVEGEHSRVEGGGRSVAPHKACFKGEGGRGFEELSGTGQRTTLQPGGENALVGGWLPGKKKNVKSGEERRVVKGGESVAVSGWGGGGPRGLHATLGNLKRSGQKCKELGAKREKKKKKKNLRKRLSSTHIKERGKNCQS